MNILTWQFKAEWVINKKKSDFLKTLKSCFAIFFSISKYLIIIQTLQLDHQLWFLLQNSLMFCFVYVTLQFAISGLFFLPCKVQNIIVWKPQLLILLTHLDKQALPDKFSGRFFTYLYERIGPIVGGGAILLFPLPQISKMI